MKGGTTMRLIGVAMASLGALVLASTAMAADAELGKKVWAQKCATCHGADGKGNATMAEKLKVKIPNLAEAAAKTDSELLKAISEGKKPMPAFGKSLKPEELDAVMHHAKGLAKTLAAGK
jgi:mono/diheme cytochrome c family protein